MFRDIARLFSLWTNNFLKPGTLHKTFRLLFINSILAFDIFVIISILNENDLSYLIFCLCGLLNGFLVIQFTTQYFLKYLIPIIFLPIYISYLFLPTHDSLQWLFPISLFLLPIVFTLLKSNIESNNNVAVTLSQTNSFINYILYTVIAGTIVYLYYRTGTFPFQGDEYYFVKEMNYFFSDEGKLFYMGEDEPYGRSKLTSILLILWIKITSLLQFDVVFTKEFIFRSLFTTLHILSSFLIYKISRFYVSKTTAIFIATIVLSEIWFIYLGTYIRFYVPSLLLILLLLYYTQKMGTKISLAIATVVSFIANFFVQAYFLFVAVYFATLLLIQLIKDKKYYAAGALGSVAGIGLIGLYIYYVATTHDQSYNGVSYSFNLENIRLQSLWLLQNYFIYTILFVGTAFWTIRNITKNIQPFLYVWLSMGFYFLYVNHVPFNFTFRPYYFFLPLLFLCSLIILDKVLQSTKLKYFIFSIILGINIVVMFTYPAHKPGHEYFPTKYVFEKHSIIFSNEEPFVYLDNLIKKYNLQNSTILSLYADDTLYPSVNYKIYQTYRWGKGDLIEYTNILDLNKKSNLPLFIVAHATASCRLHNQLYLIHWNRDCVTEVSSEYENILIENDFHIIYIAKDKNTRIYSNFEFFN